MVAARTVPRWQLGREIAHMMTVAEKSQTEVAALLDTRQSRVAGIVNGSASVTRGDLELLIRALGFSTADEKYLNWLHELRRFQQKRGFWSTGPNRAYDERVRLLLDAEERAAHLDVVYTEEMPSLLQTEGYVRSRLDQATLDERGLTADEAVEAWRKRQANLTRKKRPIHYHAVLSDSCLRAEFGGPAVMEEQIEFLISLATLPHVTIQIMPSRGRTVSMRASYYIVTVDGHRDALAGALEFAWIENPGEVLYIDSPVGLTPYKQKSRDLTAAALRPEDSMIAMRGIGDTFRNRAT
jgi:hypothetical protein